MTTKSLAKILFFVGVLIGVTIIVLGKTVAYKWFGPNFSFVALLLFPFSFALIGADQTVTVGGLIIALVLLAMNGALYASLGALVYSAMRSD